MVVVFGGGGVEQCVERVRRTRPQAESVVGVFLCTVCISTEFMTYLSKTRLSKGADLCQEFGVNVKITG